MRKFLFALIAIPTVIFSQKYDYIWVTGDNNDPLDTTKGGSVINFHFTPPKKNYDYRELNFRTCNISICDTAGNLMFYSNGCDIAGADDEILENGETINPGYVHQIRCDQYGYYTSGYQSALILPTPDSINLYYLFHKRVIIINNPFDIKADKLFYSKVDMNQNNGKGKVVAKNIEIMNNDIAYGEMTAAKHANGKDWWLVTPKRNSNVFYCFLLTKNGIIDTLSQGMGELPVKQAEGGIQIVFSPDGNKLFRSIPSGPVMVYDFDRENGLFTNFDTIHVDYGNWPSIANGCAVSPNGRYLYVSAELRIYQFDLWSDDISASQTTVAEWDGFKAPVGTLFGICQLGPDCKVYVVTIDSKYYHVINNPNEAGIACNVTQHSFILPTPSGASMPVFPNYRLGPLDNPGVPCTATVSVNHLPMIEPQMVRVYPNPSDGQVTFSWAEASSDEKRLMLHNTLGQVMKDLRLTGGAQAYTLSLSDLRTGVYFWELTGEDGRRMGAGKVVKR
ncbi:MAG: T9SS type A sorting domain-containing protein [Saprospiraceae bacterium]|nr:T9SS type A sorting domain-containing protein [Saprospiraceae bacterium]